MATPSHPEASHGGAAARSRSRLRRVHSHRRRHLPLWVELPLLLLVAFCAAVLLRTFVVQSFDIPSGSMENTLLVGDRVVVNKLIYEVREPQRGEVVVFRGSDRWHPEAQIDTDTTLTEDSLRILGDLVGIAAPNEKDLIKRIIGIGGDTVACCDEDGRVTVNGVSLDEPYIFENASEEADPTANDCRSRRFGPVDVPEGHMFVLGDHRGNSRDSRCQGFVPVENIIGRAVNIVWPKSSWASLGDVEVFADVPDAESAQAEASPSPKDSGGDSGVVAPLLLTGALFGRRRRRKRRYPDMSVLGSSPHVRSGDDRHTAPCCRHGP